MFTAAEQILTSHSATHVFIWSHSHKGNIIVQGDLEGFLSLSRDSSKYYAYNNVPELLHGSFTRIQQPKAKPVDGGYLSMPGTRVLPTTCPRHWLVQVSLAHLPVQSQLAPSAFQEELSSALPCLSEQIRLLFVLFPRRQMGRREAGGISDALSRCQQGLAVTGWWKGACLTPGLCQPAGATGTTGTNGDQRGPTGTSRNHGDQQEPRGPTGTNRDPVTWLLCGELQEQIKGCPAGTQERKGGKTKQDEVTFPSRSRTVWLLASRTSLDAWDDLQISHLPGNSLDTRPHINSYCNRTQCQGLRFPTQNVNKEHPGFSVAFKRDGVHSPTVHPAGLVVGAVDGLQILSTLE